MMDKWWVRGRRGHWEGSGVPSADTVIKAGSLEELLALLLVVQMADGHSSQSWEVEL